MTGPDVPPGTVLQLAAEQWQYADGPLRLRVLRVRHELSRYYDGRHVWIEGLRLDDAGRPGAFVQALVRIDALPPAELPGPGNAAAPGR